MITPGTPKISISKQCELLSISRSSFYYEPQRISELNLQLMRIMDEEHLERPEYGSRQMMRFLQRKGYNISRNRVRRLMQLMGIRAIYQEPKTTIVNSEHKIYPYLLRDISIENANQVWCTDITYIPMKNGFLYLVAIMDWYSRKILSWQLSNTMDVCFCTDSLQDALDEYGVPDIFNSDQGSQFTSLNFTDILKENNIRISMDGKRRWIDNVFIERLWRSLKYECVYLKDLCNGKEAYIEIKKWIDHYNNNRPHSTFDGRTPHEVYNGIIPDFLKNKYKMTA